MNPNFNVQKLRFPQRQRLTFIESVVYWEGKVDRPRVSSAFNVSENHVTKDFRLYKEAFPKNLQYDESTRVYRPTRGFKPRIGKGSPEEYLSLLKSHAEHPLVDIVPALGSSVLSDAVPQPHGKLEGAVLNAITRSISSGQGLTIQYQSMNRAQPTIRNVWPHALVFSGTRWHVRAYDENHRGFIDLVLQRFLSAKPLGDKAPLTAASDQHWNHRIDVEVIPRHRLTSSQAEVIAREFGMTAKGRGWCWKVALRECLVKYFIYLYRLDVAEDPWRRIDLKDPTLIKRYMLDETDGAPAASI